MLEFEGAFWARARALCRRGLGTGVGRKARVLWRVVRSVSSGIKRLGSSSAGFEDGWGAGSSTPLSWMVTICSDSGWRIDWVVVVGRDNVVAPILG